MKIITKRQEAEARAKKAELERNIAQDLLKVDAEWAQYRREHSRLADLLRRIRQWDHLETAHDGPYWKREIDSALADFYSKTKPVEGNLFLADVTYDATNKRIVHSFFNRCSINVTDAHFLGCKFIECTWRGEEETSILENCILFNCSLPRQRNPFFNSPFLYNDDRR